MNTHETLVELDFQNNELKIYLEESTIRIRLLLKQIEELKLKLIEKDNIIKRLTESENK